MQVVHQATLLDVQYLVESAGDVKAQCVHVFYHLARANLLVGEPFLVAESKFQLVAVFKQLHAAHDGAQLGQGHLANAPQLVSHLFLFCSKLSLVGQLLPFASAADAEVGAGWGGAYRAQLVKSHHASLGITVFFLCNLKVNDISRHTEFCEHHKLACFGAVVFGYRDTCQGFAFGSHIGYRNVLKEWERFFLSAHCMG